MAIILKQNLEISNWYKRKMKGLDNTFEVNTYRNKSKNWEEFTLNIIEELLKEEEQTYIIGDLIVKQKNSRDEEFPTQLDLVVLRNDSALIIEVKNWTCDLLKIEKGGWSSNKYCEGLDDWYSFTDDRASEKFLNQKEALRHTLNLPSWYSIEQCVMVFGVKEIQTIPKITVGKGKMLYNFIQEFKKNKEYGYELPKQEFELKIQDLIELKPF